MSEMPSAEQVSKTLQTFRRELDKRMNLNHPSASPGHEAMQIALAELFAGAEQRSQTIEQLYSPEAKLNDELQKRLKVVEAETVERCAKVCDSMFGELGGGYKTGASDCAAAIRALAPRTERRKGERRVGKDYANMPLERSKQDRRQS